MIFSGKIAVVTDADSSIGREVSRMLCSEGAQTVLLSNNAEKCSSLERELNEERNAAEFIKTDITVYEQVTDAFCRISEKYGTIDILVNNADSSGHEQGSMNEVTLEEWNDVLKKHMSSAFYCSQFAGRIMRKNKSGKIVNVSSVAAFSPMPSVSPAFAAAEGGVVNMTRTFARDLSPSGVNVNCVALGRIGSDEMTQQDAKGIALGRAGTLTEVTAAVRFLCSDESSYITGQTIDVNGGILFR